MTGGQEPSVLFQYARISCRRRCQSSAVFTGEPSSKSRGERYLPNWPAYSGGGAKCFAMDFQTSESALPDLAGAPAGTSAATLAVPPIARNARIRKENVAAAPLTL